MKVLLDTSVLVAAFLPNHNSHPESLAWVAAAKSGAVTLCAASHSLAEVFSVLTRLPPRYAVAPAAAVVLIESNIVGVAKLRSLTPNQYARVIKRVAAERLAGGIVYDALIAEVARLEKVDFLVTLNPLHFRRVWPDAANRIISPLDRPPHGS
jgi:predicted nucleic acid-binding protein